MNTRGFHLSNCKELPSIIKSTLGIFAFFILSGYGITFGQMTDVSGIQHSAGINNEQYNLISIKFENTLQGEEHLLIERELLKYKGIGSISFSADLNYVVVKYTNLISANQLLAVLDKINKRGHYLDNGVPIYYQKDQNIYFIR